MRRLLPVLLLFAATSVQLRGQDTFSILALDSVTRQVGAAGASCVDLPASLNDHFIAELFPDTGAVATQASYISSNQTNARARVRSGDSPAQLMAWLTANDVQANPGLRQYGAVQFGHPTAAYTGSACTAYASHRTGRYYSIQGNILLEAAILDSMEARFNRTQGDLACRLMAAMQGAKKPGADSRCLGNNSSSLFAFLKVSHAGDQFGSPFFLVSLRTHYGDAVEPIDSLQVLFDFSYGPCPGMVTGSADPDQGVTEMYPNPASGVVVFTGTGTLIIRDLTGRVAHEATIRESIEVDTSTWPRGMYLCEVRNGEIPRFARLLLR